MCRPFAVHALSDFPLVPVTRRYKVEDGVDSYKVEDGVNNDSLTCSSIRLDLGSFIKGDFCDAAVNCRLFVFTQSFSVVYYL